jgi:hypothetical protein
MKRHACAAAGWVPRLLQPVGGASKRLELPWLAGRSS